MSTDYDDVDKLLGQVKLQDFQYRAFGRSDAAPLRAVRSLSPTETPGQQVRLEKAAPLAVIAAVAAQPVAAASRTPPAEPSAIQVREAFARLARAGVVEGAPRLNLRLELPLRPLLPAQAPFAAFFDRRLCEVFARLTAGQPAADRTARGQDR